MEFVRWQCCCSARCSARPSCRPRALRASQRPATTTTTTTGIDFHTRPPTCKRRPTSECHTRHVSVPTSLEIEHNQVASANQSQLGPRAQIM